MQKGVENMNVVKQNVRGILLCLLLAVPAWLLGKWIPVVGGPVFAILAGMLLTLFLKDKTRWQPGVNFTSKKLLQAAVVLLGFGLNLKVVLETGRKSLPIILSTITTSLVIAFLLKKLLKVPSKSATLIGVGSSICGGSAIAATAPVIDADDEEIAQSISVIFLFNIAAALIFPSLGGLLELSDAGFGLFAGTAVNDTSSVTAAAAAWAGIHHSNTLEAATIVKLTRTLAIILFQLPAAVTAPLKELSKFFIIMAMAAIGLNTNIVHLVRTGGKPILLGFCCWVGIACVSLGAQKLLGLW